jgi:hypothetical protein
MHTFNIFVLGEFGSKTTTFVRTVHQLEEGLFARHHSHPYNFGRILFGEEMIIYFFAWSRNFSIQSLMETLAPSTLKAESDLGQMFDIFSLMDFSNTGVILIIDSADAELDEANKTLLENIQFLMRYKRFPYVVALSNPNLPGARTPQQMRAAVAVPDTIKVLRCDVKDLSSTKQVVLEVINLLPPSEIVQRLIDTLNDLY